VDFTTIGNSGGSYFSLGDSVEVVKPQVRIDQLYQIGQYQVTVQEYTDVRVWASSHGYVMNSGVGKTNVPITKISWWDMLKFCNAYSEMDSLTPCYDIEAITFNPKANGYRLPTEAEWEYASRAKATLKGDYKETDSCRYYHLPCIDPNCLYCIQTIYQDEDGNWQRPKVPEAVNRREVIGGLYGSIGNVLEWCWDVYEPYKSGSVTDPHLDTKNVTRRQYRVVRGAACDWSDFNMLPATRQCCNADFMLPHLGFRVAQNIGA
jgi:formylglycine-generating enzyme required for sulfatase activity